MDERTIDLLTKWECIGHGQFGMVYKAKHEVLKIPVAVKILKGNVSQRFKELLQEAKKLQHASTNPYVISLIEMIEAPPCIVMELMEYGSLGILMENVKNIRWALKYRILYEVAIGMNWLHSLSLLHLDLKPKNVLLNDDLHIRIADFGLSKYTSALADGEDNEGIGGTLEYMPPEAFQEGYKPSESTDIYSFAILSAVVLRGEDPYPVQNSAIISLHVTRGERPSLMSLENIDNVKNLDKAIELIKRCWTNDIHRRPSFSECCTYWERIKSGYSDNEIRDAVRSAQNDMDSTDSAGSTTDVSKTANTDEMLAMINQLQTINVSEPPSVKQKSVPVTNTNINYSRFPVQQASQINQQRKVGHYGHHPPSHRTEPGAVRNPNRNQFPGTPISNLGQAQQFRKMSPGSSYRMAVPSFTPGHPLQRPLSFPHYGYTMQPPFLASGANITIAGSTSVQVGNYNRMVLLGRNENQGTPYRTASPREYPTAPKGLNITINGNTDGVQVGDNNEMDVLGSSQHTDSNTNPVTPYSGQPVHTGFPSPAHCEPPTTTLRFSPQERNAFPGGSQSVKETARLNNQPDQTSPGQADDMRPSLQSQNISTISDSPIEHASLGKPVQEAQDS